jgi:hypothetical protein
VDRRDVISHQPLDLFSQFVVCRHALHVARRDQLLNTTPERLRADGAGLAAIAGWFGFGWFSVSAGGDCLQ